MTRLGHIAAALVLLCCLPAGAQTIAGRISAKAVAKADSIMQAGVNLGYYPGATLAVGNHKEMLFDACYGWQDADKSAKVTAEDIYDLASCTKIVSTTLAIMWLVDHDKIDVDWTLSRALPSMAATPIAYLTLRELLTHTSGLGNIVLYKLLFFNPDPAKPLFSLSPKEGYPHNVDKGVYLCDGACCDSEMVSFSARDGYRRVGECCWVNPAIDTLLIGEIIKSYKSQGRGKYLYSDLNFHLLKLVAEHAAGMPLDKIVAPLYARMRMSSTGYRPLDWKDVRNIIPTEDDRMMQRGVIRGYTHDEIGAVSDNVGGNAGLFSNVTDLSNFCRMMLCQGNFEGDQIISRATIRKFVNAPRALGFNRIEQSNKTNLLAGGYGHTGYTGTIIWIDPSKDLYMVFLSNRVHPYRTNQGLVNSMLRAKLWDVISRTK